MPVHAQGAKDSVLLAPDRAAATATRAATVDTRGFSYSSIRVNLSSGANTNAVAATLSLQEWGILYAEWCERENAGAWPARDEAHANG